MYKTPNYKTDCIYYSEDHWMEGTMHLCSKHEGLNNCPCDDCENYISLKKAIQIIEERNK